MVVSIINPSPERDEKRKKGHSKFRADTGTAMCQWKAAGHAETVKKSLAERWL
jgi:hypothetical protein